MHETIERTEKMSRSFFRFGIIVLAVALIIFLSKSLFGYEKVKMAETLSDCRVSTYSKKTRQYRGSTTYYYLRIEHKVDGSDTSIDFDKLYDPDEDYDVFKDSADGAEWETVFWSDVPYMFYRSFRDYDQSNVTFYTTEGGRLFPVYTPSCGKAEAERQYRRFEPPYLWYMFYGLALIAGIISLYMGYQCKKTAQNYQENRVYQQPVSFESTEDALAAMAVQRIRREKADKELETIMKLTTRRRRRF